MHAGACYGCLHHVIGCHCNGVHNLPLCDECEHNVLEEHEEYYISCRLCGEGFPRQDYTEDNNGTILCESCTNQLDAEVDYNNI